MLVLERRTGQRIVLSDGIVITVVRVKGEKVKLGIEAPRSTVIHREELLAGLKREDAEQNGEAS